MCITHKTFNTVRVERKGAGISYAYNTMYNVFNTVSYTHTRDRHSCCVYSVEEIAQCSSPVLPLTAPHPPAVLVNALTIYRLTHFSMIVSTCSIALRLTHYFMRHVCIMYVLCTHVQVYHHYSHVPCVRLTIYSTCIYM